jgi:P-type E1-E2 ATPase
LDDIGMDFRVLSTVFLVNFKSFVQNKSKNFSVEAENIYEVANQKNEMIVYLADEEKTIGAITFKDLLRNDAGELFTKLKNAGIKNLIMLTGDKKEKAKEIGEALGLSQIISEVTPKEKLENVQNFQKENRVAMVGDGVNDAPALAIADVGIALGSHGKTATSDVADMVVLSQSIGKVYDVFHIAKKTIYLAKQGIFLGIGASFVAMLFSAFGFVSPLYGAILQEGIDVIVILNALRLGSIIDLD